MPTDSTRHLLRAATLMGVVLSIVTLATLTGCAKDPVQNTFVQLSPAEAEAIDAHLKPCWLAHRTAPGEEESPINLRFVVTTDASGTVQKAELAPPALQEEAYEAFAAKSRHDISILLDPRCSTWPLPRGLLGQDQTFLMDTLPFPAGRD